MIGPSTQRGLWRSEALNAPSAQLCLQGGGQSEAPSQSRAAFADAQLVAGSGRGSDGRAGQADRSATCGRRQA
eukprot:12109203-Alexandrium_andersonii.AAC.1